MSQGIGRVGKATGTPGTSQTVTATFVGGNSTAGSTLLAFLSIRGSFTSVTTPSGATLRDHPTAVQNTDVYLFEFVNASAKSGISITYTTSAGDAIALDIFELTGTGSYDSNATDKNGTGSATLTTNGITTVGANTIMVALFAAASGTLTPRTLNAPGTGFTQVQADNEVAGTTTAVTNYCMYQVVTSTQSNVSTQCTSSSAANYQGLLYAYAQAVAASWQPYTRNDRFDSLIQQADFAYESRRAMLVLPAGASPTTWIPLSRKGSWEDIPDDWDD